MKRIICLSILSFLWCFMNNEEVSAIRTKRSTLVEDLPLQDPRLQPQKYCDSSKCTPTVMPTNVPDQNILADVDSLFSAMNKWGTNEHAIIRIVTSLGIVQRIRLAKAYKEKMAGKVAGKGTLEAHLNNEIGGVYRIAMVAVITPLPIFYAQELQKSIVPDGTDEQTLVEILCTVNNFGVKAIVEFYKDQFSKSLEADIVKDTAGSFQKVLVSLIQGKRVEDETVDNVKAAADAKALNEPDAKPWKVKPAFSDILSTRSYPHLRQVFIEYKTASGHEIEDDIKKEFPGPEGLGLLAIVKCVRSKVKFFADRLEEVLRLKDEAMDRPLIRILVSRSEIDLGDIKIEYEKVYKKTLESVVADKIGGDYRRTLTNMIRGNAAPPPPQQSQPPPPQQPQPPPPQQPQPPPPQPPPEK